MTPAAKALHLRRCERHAWKTADGWASADEVQHPYWRGNLYLYQNQALRFGDRRIAILRSYLVERRARATFVLTPTAQSDTRAR